MKKILISGLLAGLLLVLSVTIVAAEGGKTHTVKPGESLSSIAYYYGVSANAIMQANGLSNPDYIYVHQKLTIPGTGHQATVTCTQYYVVQWGDTLSGIAWKHGTSINAIKKASSLDNDWIHEDQKLCLSSSSQSGYSAPTSYSHYHIVQAGDTISGIAYHYGISQKALIQANHLTDASWISVGQKLAIPG
ncbi:MAG: LysM peptidoglycan-binding domain-containing protein, partial [Chloroflexota bacterium]